MEGTEKEKDCNEGYGATFAHLSSWTFDRKQQLVAELEFTRYTYSEDQREIEKETPVVHMGMRKNSFLENANIHS
jgi:hypothetical protein